METLSPFRDEALQVASEDDTWSVYSCGVEEEDNAYPSLRTSGLRKQRVLARGSQGVVYEALEKSEGESTLRRVAVKRLYSCQELPYGAVGIPSNVLREPSLLRYVHHRHNQLVASSALEHSHSAPDSTIAVVELYRVVEAPFSEVCLVLEHCATDLARIFHLTHDQDDDGCCDDGEEESAGNAVNQRGLSPIQWTTSSDEENDEGEDDNAGAPLLLHGLSVDDESRRPLPSCPSPSPPQAELTTSIAATVPSLAVQRFLIRRVLQILRFLHDNCSVCHRDIKPSNILVKETGELRLCDFGSACFQNQLMGLGEKGSGLTPSSLRTTRCYNAPECLLGQPYDGRLDVWSAGVIFAEVALQRTLWNSSCDLSMLTDIYDLLGPSNEAVKTTSALPSPDSRSVGCTALEYLLREVLPPDGVDFTSQLLALDPEKRVTAAEALKHSFLMFPGWEEDDKIGEHEWKALVHQRTKSVDEKHSLM